MEGNWTDNIPLLSNTTNYLENIMIANWLLLKSWKCWRNLYEILESVLLLLYRLHWKILNLLIVACFSSFWKRKKKKKRKKLNKLISFLRLKCQLKNLREKMKKFTRTNHPPSWTFEPCIFFLNYYNLNNNM